VWVRHARACVVATSIGAAVMGLAVATFHLVPHGSGVVRTYVEQARTGQWTPTIFTMALGDLGWVVSVVLVAGAVAVVARARRADLAALAPGADG
jgi:hypothetical protein